MDYPWLLVNAWRRLRTLVAKKDKA
jgi:hypothetical protein